MYSDHDIRAAIVDAATKHDSPREPLSRDGLPGIANQFRDAVSGTPFGSSQYQREIQVVAAAAEPSSSDGQPPCAIQPSRAVGGTSIGSGPLQREHQTIGATAEPSSQGGQAMTDCHGSVAALRTQIDHGHDEIDSHLFDAVVDPASDEGQVIAVTPPVTALVGNITVECRRYEDLRRARQRLELQAMATCRNLCGGDKVAGAKLYAAPTPAALLWLAPYRAAIEQLDGPIAGQEKVIAKLAKQLPVAEWAAGVSGLSDRFLGMIVGECAIGPGEYRSVSALWKRMGLAVIGGERQRRVTGEAALEHGYVARRRSLMWNIGNSILKQQVRSQKDEAGKKVEGSEYAIGPLGQVYLDRRAHEAPRCETNALIHNRAKRYMEKRLLRELWKAWRREAGLPLSTFPIELSPEAQEGRVTAEADCAVA